MNQLLQKIKNWLSNLKKRFLYIPCIYKANDKKLLKTTLYELNNPKTFSGGSIPEINFFRTEFINDRQSELVGFCKEENYGKVTEYYNVPKYYSKTYADELFCNRIGLRLIYNLLCAKTDKGKLCDFAAGNGQLALKLSAVGFDVSICDMNEYRVSRICSKDPLVKAHTETIEGCTFADNSFDIAILTECLEHVINLEKALKNIYRLIKPGGEVYVTVPYLQCIDYESHIRLFNENNLFAVFNQMGFEVKMLKRIGYLNHQKGNSLFMIAKRI